MVLEVVAAHECFAKKVWKKIPTRFHEKLDNSNGIVLAYSGISNEKQRQ